MKGHESTPLNEKPSFQGPPCWALFSGGKDSIATAHYLNACGKLLGIVALDTGISTPDWRPHIDSVAERFGWELHVFRTPASYEDLVRKYGFPGPPLHGLFFNYLKGRPMRQAKKALGGPFASGVRSRESQRRMRNVGPVGEIEGAKVYAPIHDWTTEETWAYVRAHNLPIAPAHERLHISGDCLCGAYARREEAWLLRGFYPDIAARLSSLEGELPESAPRWGHGEGFTSGQKRIESFLCHGCERKPV